ncbi:MAG TPA: hypothetical protein ENJ20_03205 [Bacteroidetes bacterium]|nr:hypothetical protein [Bacteroidota bacterium]
MRLFLLTLIAFSLLFTACADKKNNITPNGYEVIRLNKSNGKKPATGDIAIAQLYFYADGKLINSTRKNNRAMPIRIYSEEELKKMKETGKPNPIYEAVSIMSVGDSVKVPLPITEEIRNSPSLANAQEAHYIIVLEEAKTEEEMKAEQQAEKKSPRTLN